MIKIINKRGEIMELASNMAIPYEKNNTLFNSANVFVEDLTYPGTAPLTDSNKVFFNIAHRIETAGENYEFEVSLFVGDEFMFAGILTSKLSAKGFDFTIKPNFAAVRDIAVDFSFQQIHFDDLINLPAGKTLAQHMLDTATNPDDYDALFFPIKNEYQYEAHADGTAYSFVNMYSGNVFTPIRPDVDLFRVYVSPYFKLNYILKKCCEFLGFQAEGSIFSEPDFIKKTIYTRLAAVNPETYHLVNYNSNLYMPDMILSDFIKNIAVRYQLNFSFDFATKKVVIDSFEHIKKNGTIHDISQYIETTNAIEPAKENSYTIKLKPDSDDLVYNSITEEYEPMQTLQVLKIGDGKTNVELECGTLSQDFTTSTLTGNKILFVKTRQNLRNITSQFLVVSSEAVNFTSKLRVINYDGLYEYETGKFWPQSSAEDLNEKDAYFYNFKSKAKVIKIKANIPPAVFSKINTSDRIVFKDEYGSYQVCLIENIKTDLYTTQLLPVLFTLRSLSAVYNNFNIVDVLKENDDVISYAISGKFGEHTPILIQAWKPSFGGAPAVKIKDLILTKSATNYGAGGTIESFTIAKSELPVGSFGYVEFRFYDTIPTSAKSLLGLDYTIYTTSSYKFITAFTNDAIFLRF